MKMRHRACPGCGKARDQQVAAEADFDESRLDPFSFASRKLPEFMHLRLLRGDACDLLYAAPAPDRVWLQEAYARATFDAASEARRAATTYARKLDRIAAEIPDLDGALDIGTGDGAFLEALLDAGFSSVTGIEPSRAPIAAAADTIRPLIRNESFGDTAFEPESFSIISCFQTLEHVDDPFLLARRAFDLLKPGGAFFTVAHNFRALTAKRLGTRSPIYDIEHLQLFSRRSLHVLYESAGYTNISTAPLSNAYPLSYWLRLAPLPERAKPRLQRWLRTAGINEVVVPLRAGNLVGIGYKPATAPEKRPRLAAGGTG